MSHDGLPSSLAPGPRPDGPPGEPPPAAPPDPASLATSLVEVLAGFSERLDRIESTLAALAERQAVKEWYSTAEVAGILGRAEYTVREWCRQGRVRAKKKPCGRGKGGEWLVSHEELTRLKNEGLRPTPRPHPG